MEYYQLCGTETVAQAGRQIASAAETIAQNLQWHSEVIRELLMAMRELQATVGELRDQLGKGGA